MQKIEVAEEIFTILHDILIQYCSALNCTVDESDHYYLDTWHIMSNKKPMFFGAVKIGKSYVSYHLMPVYVFPELLETLSPALAKRMQGKSCFNFRTVDKRLFDELSELTSRGFRQFKNAGYIQQKS